MARRLDLRSLLARAEAAAPVGAVDAMAAAMAEALDARDVSFLIADFSGRSLNRLGHTAELRSEETAESVPLLGSPYGEALASQRIVLLREGDDTRMIAPVSSRGEAVGVLELILPFAPDPFTVEDIELAAHQLAYIVIANRRYTDLFEWGQRTVPLSLAAEIQRRLLPASFTCEADQFTLAAWLEPAGQVGGDTFDFSLDRNVLHISITDAMGHSVASALLATLAVGALRNVRRRNAGVVDQAQAAHDALLAYSKDGGFVTGQLMRIDLVAETARMVKRGPSAAVPAARRRRRAGRARRGSAVRRGGGRHVARAGAAAAGRRPPAAADRRDARAQRGRPRHPRAAARDRAPPSARGDPGAHARGAQRCRR